MFVIVDTDTGDKVGDVRGKAHWPDGAVTHAPKAGLQRGAYRLVEVVESVAGEGPLIAATGEEYDGENWVVAKVRSYPPLADLKAAKCAEVDAERDRRRWPGSVDTGLGWHIDFRDATDEANIGGLALEAVSQLMDGAVDPVIGVRGADDVTRLLTPAQMVAVGRVCRQHISDVYVASWTIKAAINAAVAAEDREALDTVDVANHPSWPA